MRVTVTERRGRPAAQASIEELLAGLGWTLWRWRVELVAVGVLLGAARGLAQAMGTAGAVIVACIAGAAVVGTRTTRNAVFRALRRAHVRRGWERAVVDTGLARSPLAAPRALAVKPVAAGDCLRVRVPRGQSVAQLEARCEELAACLRAREV